MPNWSSNAVIIEGTDKDLDAFLDTCPKKGRNPMERTLLLSTHVPMPESKKADWYNWNVEHWGTKWDIADEQGGVDIHTEDEEELKLWFDSAWSPPVKWAVAVSKQFPKLKITIAYIEQGMDFFGVYSAKNGKVLEDNVHNDVFKDDVDWDTEDDMFNALTPAAREHVEAYDIGSLGG